MSDVHFVNIEDSSFSSSRQLSLDQLQVPAKRNNSKQQQPQRSAKSTSDESGAKMHATAMASETASIHNSLLNSSVNVSESTVVDNGLFMQRREAVETPRGGVTMQPSTMFRIPELPSGKVLQFNLLSTWGDPHYLGLMGIELFDADGHPIQLHESQIWADPADINVLPEYDDDPRTVDHLVDHNHLLQPTCDDLHAWLIPFTPGRDHLLRITLIETTALSMIRVWNYNKSRIHSFRGARYVEITLDKTPIFKGEIRQASGCADLLDFDTCCEHILFTTDQRLLRLVEHYDGVYQRYLAALHAEEQELQEEARGSRRRRDLLSALLVERAELEAQQQIVDRSGKGSAGVEGGGSRGVSRGHSSSGREEMGGAEDGQQGSVRFDQLSQRPTTAAAHHVHSKSKQSTGQNSSSSSVPLKRPSTAMQVAQQPPILCQQTLQLCIMSNWGDAYSLGLQNLAVLDNALNELSIGGVSLFLGTIDATSNTLRVLCEADEGGLEYDAQNLARLGSGILGQMGSGHSQRSHNGDPGAMFSVSRPLMQQRGFVCLQLTMTAPVYVKALRIWNYNDKMGSPDTSCGLKHVALFVDFKKVICSYNPLPA